MRYAIPLFPVIAFDISSPFSVFILATTPDTGSLLSVALISTTIGLIIVSVLFPSLSTVNICK